MTSPIPSPCVNICLVHPATGFCIGCQRSVDEIAGWAAYSDSERARILAKLPSREDAHKAKSARPSRARRARRRDRAPAGES